MYISVITCLHNPRPDFLVRVLLALHEQTLPKSEWEIIIIDNASKQNISDELDINWHPNARVVREDNLGLTFARIRGIVESKAEILVFIDGDNILEKNYLQNVMKEFQANSRLGCIGAGKIIPEFESTPPREVAPFFKMLAIRDSDLPIFSSLIDFSDALPYGAGLAIKRGPALDYVQSCRNSARRSALDRSGENLLSGGDIDLVLHACRLGLMAGVVPELQLVHLIPDKRLNPCYLVHLARGHAISHALLARLWGYERPKQNPLAFLWRTLCMVAKERGLARRIKVAEALETWKIRNRRSSSAS